MDSPGPGGRAASVRASCARTFASQSEGLSLKCRVERRHGSGVFPPRQVHDPEVVEPDAAVARRQELALAELDSAGRGVDQRQVVARRDERRLPVQRLGAFGDRPRVIPFRKRQVAQIVERVRRIRIERDRPLEPPARLDSVAEHVVHGAQRVLRGGPLRRQVHGHVRVRRGLARGRPQSRQVRASPSNAAAFFGSRLMAPVKNSCAWS